MLEIAMPKIEVVQAAENYGRFKIEPLDPGYGHTLGNALRRVLISSIPGSAVTKIKLEGIYHEFSTVRGIREDVTEIVLNVKGIRLRSWADRQVKIQLLKRGAGVVRAGDIETPSNVQIVNPNHYLCTIDGEDAVLEMDLTVERNKGYLPADQRDPTIIGEIPVDAIFTPVPRVNYVVENTRVGQATDHDRLLIEIWTDGTIKAGDALSHAAKVLVQYCQTVADFNQLINPPQPPAAPGPLVIPREVYELSLDELKLSTRTYNALKRAEITKVGQLLEMEDGALQKVRHIGDKGIAEIRERLLANNFIPRF
jgi:DNA-directed RNA polymerase subunit alpha